MTKKGDRYCFPQICMCCENAEAIEVYNDTSFEEIHNNFKSNIINERIGTHTGNHYRNKFVSVPKKSIGQ